MYATLSSQVSTRRVVSLVDAITYRSVYVEFVSTDMYLYVCLCMYADLSGIKCKRFIGFDFICGFLEVDTWLSLLHCAVHLSGFSM